MTLQKDMQDLWDQKKPDFTPERSVKQGERSGKNTLIWKAVDQAVHLPVQYF